MRTQTITLIAIFAAIAIALNIVRIPTLYWPGFFYSFFEIVVIIAFLLFGFKIGILVEVLHVAGQLLLFPVGPAGFAAYPMGVVAILIMMTGVYVGSRIITRKASSGDNVSEKKSTAYLTGVATAFRGGLMPFLDYGVMYHVLFPLVLGISIPETYIAALIPAFILYNVTVPLYTVPIAYIVAVKVSEHLNMEPRFII